MTIKSPVSITPPRSDDVPVLRRIATPFKLLLQDVAAALRPRRSLALQPFSFLPDQASMLVAGVGAQPPLIPGYAFHTHYVPSKGHRVQFDVRMPGLTATAGMFDLAIIRLDEQGVMLDPVHKGLPLARLVAQGGSISIETTASPGFSYAVMATVSDDSDARADDISITMIGGEDSDALDARFSAAKRGFLSAPGSGPIAPIIVDRSASLAAPISQMCTAAQMREPEYLAWCQRLGIAPSSHRKQWEFVFICRALEYHGALREGARGLGFGVGIEPLPSAFAAAGCHILATDLPADDDRAAVWNATDQLGSSLRQIHQPALCDEKIFFDRVSYRPIDMTAIPPDLTGFDFTWSSCAYEHLGSIDTGLDFFENSLACLKPGGLAVHTTELNLSSNSDTLNNGPTVLFRRRDFEALAERLILRGHDVLPITFDSGGTDLDRVIDVPPYSHDPHLRLALLRWVATSFGMIVRKGPEG